MFGQVNSEHCRHKIFRASWIIDGEEQPQSLFDMIRHTHRTHPGGTLSAYRDNSAVLEGFPGTWFEVPPGSPHVYRYTSAQMDMMVKVETHNHPTAISPFAGAATGVGGEIRDEGATGTGARSKAGLCGFMVSNLNLPDFPMPWEKSVAPFPTRLATPLEIMTEGPLGGAGFGNEYGRPQLCGFFKTYEELYNGCYWGYHKPIMLAGGMGNIKRGHTRKRPIPSGAYVIQLGGPAMRIGLGGGAASSMDTGSNAENLDFDSVQRDNAEMQRRCQEVISACIALGDRNPILSIHDIGAGGLSNGCPELVEEVGARFELRRVPNEEPSMSPMEIWCCEAQERYVLAVAHDDLEAFLEVCRRERCRVAVIGETTGDRRLVVHDEHLHNTPIDLDLQVLLGKPPRLVRDVRRRREQHPSLDLSEVTLREAARRVLQLPAVANKTFLITIADRSITGMVARDQMVGPYQTPISDVAVTASSYHGYRGEAMAVGERTRLAVVSAPASGRMAVAEALLNLAGASIGPIGNVKLSANWMAACAEAGQDANLFDTVRSVALDLCPQLGVCIPVGKDSLSMRTVWQDRDGRPHRQVAPLSLCVSAFAPVRDVRQTVTADLKRVSASTLLLVDLGHGRNRLGGASALAQVYNQVGAEFPDVDSADELKALFGALQELVGRGLLLACHDRSDGGLFVTLCEMAFGARTGFCCDLSGLSGADVPLLFAEELGVVLQVADERRAEVESVLAAAGLAEVTHRLGRLAADGRISFVRHGRTVFAESLSALLQWWSELTWRMQTLRDHPECASQEFEALADESDPGMTFRLSFDPARPFAVASGARPRLAVLREQGINGQVEMAAAFDRAGFESVDVHMTDLLAGRADLAQFAGLVACGGFSYGDVLGAGSGWAKSILFNPRLRDMFAAFFARNGTFALGVCNGCQMVSQLKAIIPGADHWPAFTRNRCEQFEARYVTVEVLPSPSVLLAGMAGSRLGIPVAHGEGLANFALAGSLEDSVRQGLVTMRFVDNRGLPAERYPLNPNGSPGGLTGLTTRDGRVTIMMPHPERAFRRLQLSYAPPDWQWEEGPWLRLFQNARSFVG
jgi:phosphoribosylformylglycinamidine synthase